MAKDYKHVAPPPKPRPKPRRKGGMPGWAWLVLGMALGLSAGGLWWLNSQPQKAPPKQGKGEKAEKPAPSVHYEFYKVLPERKVSVPPPRREVQPEQKPKPSQAFLIQVGSFQALAPADRLKARLALLGIEASIEEVRVRGKTLYRVRVGPFPDKAKALAMQSRLRAHRLEAILLRADGGAGQR